MNKPKKFTWKQYRWFLYAQMGLIIFWFFGQIYAYSIMTYVLYTNAPTLELTITAWWLPIWNLKTIFFTYLFTGWGKDVWAEIKKIKGAKK